MSNEILPPSSNSNSIIITPDDTSISLAQAIYHHITTKTERVTESFRDNYAVSYDDIIQLAHIIKQVAQRYHEGEWSCNIDHAIFKRSRTRYSSLDRFKISDKGQAEPTSEIVITYDFLSKNPFTPADAQVDPERYKVVVRISQEPYLSMLDDENSRPSFVTRLLGFPAVTASVSYVDYTVARAILSAVKDWVSALESSKPSKLSRSFLKNEIAISTALPSTLSAAVLLGVGGIAYHTSSRVSFTVIIAFALSTFIFGVGTLITESIMSSIYKLQRPTTILITKGDVANKGQIDARRKKARRTLGVIFSVIVLGIAINVVSSFLYSWLIK